MPKKALHEYLVCKDVPSWPSSVGCSIDVFRINTKIPYNHNFDRLPPTCLTVVTLHAANAKAAKKASGLRCPGVGKRNGLSGVRRPLVRKTAARSISTIASDISRNWGRPYYGAVPYLNAMYSLHSISDNYGADTGQSVVLYFLANAQSWRGPEAKRIKRELNALLPARYRSPQ